MYFIYCVSRERCELHGHSATSAIGIDTCVQPVSQCHFDKSSGTLILREGRDNNAAKHLDEQYQQCNMFQKFLLSE